MPNAYDLIGTVDLDPRPFDRKAAGVERRLRQLAELDPSVEIDVDDREAHTDIRSVDDALRSIDDHEVAVLAETESAHRDVDSVQSALASIEDESVAITATADEAHGEITSVGEAVAGLPDGAITVTGDAEDALSDLTAVSAAVAGLPDGQVAVTADGEQAHRTIGAVTAALRNIEDEDVRVTTDTREAQANVQSLEAALAGLEDQTVRVSTETAGMGSSFGAAAGHTATLGGTIGSVVGRVSTLKAGVAGLAGGAAVAGFSKLAMGAAELDDSLNATNQVFQDSSGVIDEWAGRSVTAVGLSERSFRELSAPLGALMRSLGATGDEVAHMSNEVVSLGADFASVLGGSTPEAVQAIGAAFRGETEPIRRYGITLDAAAVQERALAMGLVDSAGKITNRARVLRDLIVEQAEANGYVGDFERTQREGVNSVRMMTNTLADAGDELGRAFVPAMVAGANAVTDLVTEIGPLIDIAVWLGERAMPSAAKGVGWLIDGITDLVPPLRAAKEAADMYGAATEGQARAQSYAKGTADGYADRQEHLKNVLADSKGPADDAAAGVRGVGDEARNARAPIEDMATALERIIGVHLSSEQAHLRWEESLLRVEESLRENGHHLDGNSEKHLKLKGDILNAVNSTLAYAAAMEGEHVAQGKVNNFLSTARQRLIDKMVAEGMSREEAERHLFTLGFTQEALDRVAHSTSTAKHRTDEMRGSIESARGATWMASGVFGGWAFRLGETSAATDTAKAKTDNLRGSVDVSGSSAIVARDRFGLFKLGVEAVPNDKSVRIHTPGLHEAHVSLDAFKQKIDNLKGGQVNFSLKLINEHVGRPGGDGPGGPIPSRGGKMVDRIRSILPAYPGLRITSTYRTPARNRAVGGSPTSYHLDFNNPAVDVGGPSWQLDRLHAALRASGGLRELIWRAPGHYDHLHAAHDGEYVRPESPGWTPGLASDERLRVLQVGEGVFTASEMATLSALAGGSSAPVPVVPPVTVVVQIPGNAPDAALVAQMAEEGARRGVEEATAEMRRMRTAGVKRG